MSRRVVAALGALILVSVPTVAQAETPLSVRTPTAAVSTAPDTVPRALARPTAPRSVTATAGNRTVTLRWRAPSSAGDRPITGYRIQRRIGSTFRTITTVAAPVRRFVIAGLENGTVQRVRVQAVSRAGAGRAVVRQVILPAAFSVSVDSATGNNDPNLACALTPARTVRCWGSNSRGALGIGSAAPSELAFPIEVRGLQSVAEVEAGGEFACARKTDGTVWCWGADLYNQLPGRSGDSFVPYQIPGISGARQLSVGPVHTCVLVTGGTLRCFGNNGNGQVGNGSTAPSDVVTPAISDVVDVSAGGFHTCAVRSDGTLACWGWSSADHAFGLPGTGNYTTPTDIPGITTARQVAAGTSFTCVRLANGNAQCAGRNSQGQIGNATNTTAETFADVFDVGTMTDLRAGRATVCARFDDGTLRCWGDNYGGGLGIGEAITTSKSVPTPTVGLGPVRSFEVGSSNVCAITRGWQVRCVGLDDTGQLGDGASGGFSTEWVEPIGF